MQRRDFLKLTGFGLGAIMLPNLGVLNAASLEAAVLDTSDKKKLADLALDTARAKGATYCDVRIGRYFNQYIFAREDKVQNVVDALSMGIGIRVIVNGTWGFASTDALVPERVVQATEEAVAIAKATRFTKLNQ
jgi:Predicted Zn-dependent proteases and their inactivated homologs